MQVHLTIHIDESSLWVGTGARLFAAALLVVGVVFPEWALWMIGIVLALLGILMLDLGLWIVIVVSSWLESRSEYRENAIENISQSGRMFPGL
jgi:hypothetical protein